MISFDDNLKITLLVFLISCYIIYERKPDFMFKPNGEFKAFGLRKDQTTFPFHIAVILIAFGTYYGLLLKKGNFV